MTSDAASPDNVLSEAARVIAVDTRTRGAPNRDTKATPTAATDATLQTIAPATGRRDRPPSTAKPTASDEGRRPGEKLEVSFCPRRRKSAPIPKTFAAIAAAARASAT